ncbi:MAG: glycosyltransferase, partial [Ignavibacteriales bacterium]|nr:glycosyltransferase [Ignavibacteriales bacterium]
MSNLSQDEIFKYDYLYEKYPEEYGQVNGDEPRFAMAYKYLQAITGVKTVLDAGVGRGGFYNLIKEQYDVYGIEPSKVAIEQFHRGDERIKPMYIQEIPQHFEHDTFDAVVCLDVLEHIPYDDIDAVFSALAQVGRKYFIFSIARHSDVWDEMELHVANLPYAQWEQKLANHFRCLVKLPIHGGLSWVYLLEKKELLSSYNALQFDLDQKSKFLIPSLFSVIVPTYNQAQYLGEALDSIRAQTYEYWEAIIVNDGSIDDTAEVMEAYAFQDPRFRCFHKENGGVASALNEGVRDKLEIHKNAIEANPEIKFFHSHFYYLVEETNAKTEPDLWFNIPEDEYQVSRFFMGNYVHGNAIAIHRTVFDEVGLFDESLRQAQDFDMWLRVSAKFRSHFINKRTCVTRLHKGQTTNSFPEGCYFDSAWACAKFFNKHSFNEIFPLLDLQKELDARKALLEVITLSATEGSFMNYGGFMPSFVDRANEWISNESP